MLDNKWVCTGIGYMSYTTMTTFDAVSDQESTSGFYEAHMGLAQYYKIYTQKPLTRPNVTNNVSPLENIFWSSGSHIFPRMLSLSQGSFVPSPSLLGFQNIT